MRNIDRTGVPHLVATFVMTSLLLPASVTPAIAGGSAYEEVDCPQTFQASSGPFSCGYLAVPEDADSNSGRSVRLFVTRYLPHGEPYPDPVLAFDPLGWEFDPNVAPVNLRDHREVIVMHPRGVGRSEPNLACPEVEALAALRFETRTDDPGTRATLVDAVASCRARLSGEGIDLTAYDPVHIAADAEALRSALGVEQWNLRAVGSGARVAFEIVRRNPEHVRAVWLDSPDVPTRDLLSTGIIGTRHALAEILSACADDAACHDMAPNLGSLLPAMVTRFEEEPIAFQGDHDGPDIKGSLDGPAWLLALRDGMTWWPELVPQGMSTLDELFASSPQDWITNGPAFMRGYEVDAFDLHNFDHGAWFSSVCRDQLPFTDQEALSELAGEEPGYGGAFVEAPWFDVCSAWDVGSADPSVNEALTSDVPALILHGRFDPYAPRPLAEEALAMFSNGWRVEYPTKAFNVLSEDCAIALRNSWIDDPTSPPDTSCTDALPPMTFATTQP
jgi:pimeloyl-ACP methyl ester carboxylesterase